MSNAKKQVAHKQIPTGFAKIEVWATAHGKAQRTLAVAIKYLMGRPDKPELEWYSAPKKDASAAHRRFYEQINKAIVQGMAQQEVEDPEKDNKADWAYLFLCPIQALNEGNAMGQIGDPKTAAYGTRRYVQAQVGLYRGRIKAAHKAALGGNKKGPDQKRTDDRTFCLERVVAMQKRLQKAEKPSFDLTEAMHHLAAFERVVKTTI
jgi:hypothetical protein